MSRLKIWIQAFRLRTLPLSLASIGMGSFLALSHGSFKWAIFILTLLTTVFLQILSNLANDYGDFIHGADHNQREGPLRTVQQGLITPSQMKAALYVFSFSTLSIGVVLLIFAFPVNYYFFIFLIIGLAAIFAAMAYTLGKKPYGYMGLGDVSVFIFFGLVGVIGSYYLQTKSIDWNIILPSSACGFFAVGVLTVNNIRDIESDKIAGKQSIPVRIGRKYAVWYYWSLLFLGIGSIVVYTILTYSYYSQWLFVAVIPLVIINGRAVKLKLSRDLDPYLKQLAIITLVTVILVGLGLIIKY